MGETREILTSPSVALGIPCRPRRSATSRGRIEAQARMIRVALGRASAHMKLEAPCVPSSTEFWGHLALAISGVYHLGDTSPLPRI